VAVALAEVISRPHGQDHDDDHDDDQDHDDDPHQMLWLSAWHAVDYPSVL
jgi:hypothetical protein